MVQALLFPDVPGLSLAELEDGNLREVSQSLSSFLAAFQGREIPLFESALFRTVVPSSLSGHLYRQRWNSDLLSSPFTLSR